MKPLQVIYLLFFSSALFGQKNNSMFISTSVGLGIVEGHNGFSIDGEIGRKILSRFNASIYYNMMSSQREINPEYERYNVSITDLYLELLSNYYTRNIQRSQNSIGLQITYSIINSNKFQINLGGGPNYNFYKMLDLTITSSEPFIPHAEYWKWHEWGVSKQLVADFYYRLSDSMGLGLKTRLLDFKDYNLSFLVSTKVEF